MPNITAHIDPITGHKSFKLTEPDSNDIYTFTYNTLFNDNTYVAILLKHHEIRRSKIESANSYEHLEEIFRQLNQFPSRSYQISWQTLLTNQ